MPHSVNTILFFRRADYFVKKKIVDVAGCDKIININCTSEAFKATFLLFAGLERLERVPTAAKTPL